MRVERNHVLNCFRCFSTKLKNSSKSNNILRIGKPNRKSTNVKQIDNKSNNKSFNELFLNSNSNSSGSSTSSNTQNHKISDENGFNALYEECMNKIYERRDELNLNLSKSKEIEDLNRFEDKIIKNIFNRLYPNSNNNNNYNNNNNNNNNINSTKEYTSCYWNPFRNIGNLKLEIVSEFNQLSKLVNNVELYKYKLMIKKSLNQHKQTNTLNDANFDQNIEDSYVNKNDMFWDPNISKKLVLTNHKRPFCFRDLNVLHYFVAENGQILPRRINQTSRQQQKQIFRAVSTAKKLLLLPYSWKPLNRDRIPLIYPIQYLFDELFYKYEKEKDLRAQQMINILMEKFPHLNCHRRKINEIGKSFESQACECVPDFPTCLRPKN